jgi:hypothetical protein
VLKTMDASFEALRYVLERSPETKIVVFRKYYGQSDAMRAWLDSGDGAALADEVYAMFAGCLALCEQRGVTAYLEDLNEMPWDPWSEMPDKQARLSAAFAGRCAELGVRPAVLSIAVGNPPGSFEERAWIWEKLYPALYAAQNARGALSRHLYGAPRMWQPEAKYYALRYRDDRAMWPADLQSLPELVTECGIDGGVIGAASAAVAGWRAYVNAEQYVADLEWFGDEIGKDKYILGATIFTAGGDYMWESFDITGEPKIQAFIRDQHEEVDVAEPTTINALNQPAGEPGETVMFEFQADGIDGTADGFAGLEFPIIPGTENTYGPGSQHRIGQFQNGEVDVEIAIPEATTPLPKGGVIGSIFIQIVELDGVNFDGGRHGPYPIALLAKTTGQGPGHGGGKPEPDDEIDEAAVKQNLDELWALAAAFGMNGDTANEAYIKQRVIAIKEATGV